MARSDITTMIPLDRAAAILGINPYHFNQLTTERHPYDVDCDDLWFQTAYQDVGKASRDDFAIALRQAEDLTVKYLGYYPVATWIDSEESPVEKPYNVQFRNWRGINSRGQAKSLTTKFGHVIEPGRRAKTLIDDNATITYSDADGDGYNELATVTVTTSVTDAQEIKAYFPSQSGADMWEIRPINVSIASGTATITFGRWLVPVANLWVKDPATSDPTYRAIDGDDTANFLTVVDIYRVYTDTSTQATFYHENMCLNCNGDGCTACGFATNTGCLRVRDSRLGLVSYTAATWDADNSRFTYSESCYPDPDKIIFHYRAGTINRSMKYPYVDIDPTWERAIVYYALTKLDRADGLCNNTMNIWNRMSVDLAHIDQATSFSLSAKVLNNPLGTTQAATDLWRMVEQHRLLR